MLHIEYVACGFTESFSIAVLDAWVYGFPVITTPVGGIPDIAIDGKNMLLFNPGAIDAIIEQMEKIISNDNLRQSIAAVSTFLAQTTFNVKTINQQLGEMYEEAMEEKQWGLWLCPRQHKYEALIVIVENEVARKHYIR